MRCGKLLVLFLIVLSLFLVSCENLSDDILTCDDLAKNLDSLTNENGNLQVNIDEKAQEEGSLRKESHIVGGKLIEISVRQKSIGDTTFRYLIFKGLEKEIKLHLYGEEENSIFPYEVGKFYKFDTVNIRVNGALSGGFIDDNLDKLEEVNC
jgi:hypothetical protein